MKLSTYRRDAVRVRRESAVPRCRRNWCIENHRRWRARVVFTMPAMITNGRRMAGEIRGRRYIRATLWCRTSRPRRKTMKTSSPCRCRTRRSSRSLPRQVAFTRDSRVRWTIRTPPSSWASRRPWTNSSNACPSPTGEFLLFSGDF